MATNSKQDRPSDEAQQGVGAPVDEELRLLVVPARVGVGLNRGTSDRYHDVPLGSHESLMTGKMFNTCKGANGAHVKVIPCLHDRSIRDP